MHEKNTVALASLFVAASLVAFAASADDPLSRSGTSGSVIGIGDARYLKLDASNDPLTGALTIPDGATATPSLNFTSDATTGFWRTGANNIGFSKGGSEVGELTTAGWQALGSTAAAPAFSSISDTNTGMYFVGADELGFSTGGTLRMNVTTAQFVPRLPMQITGGSVSTPDYAFNADTNTGMYNVGADDLGFATNGTLRQDISTTAITTTLVELGPNGAVGAPAYSFSGDPDTGMYDVSANNLGFATNGTVGMILSSSQNLAFFGNLGGGAGGSAPAVADAVGGYNLMSTPTHVAADCDAAGEVGRMSSDQSSTHPAIWYCPGAAGWTEHPAGGLSHQSDTIRRSATLTHGGTFLMISGTAYFIYLGEATSFGNTAKFCKFDVTTAGAGAQTAEVGLFSSPAPPNGTNQSMTKLVATGTVDSLTGTGIKANTTSFATSITPGTYVWCGIRTAMATTQPIIEGVSGDDSVGSIETLAGSGVLTGAGPFAATIPALSAVGTAVGPELRLWF